jgi:hypothetical protein
MGLVPRQLLFLGVTDVADRFFVLAFRHQIRRLNGPLMDDSPLGVGRSPVAASDAEQRREYEVTEARGRKGRTPEHGPPPRLG